jgi:uncharacterized protein YcbK (DUF882 family)
MKITEHFDSAEFDRPERVIAGKVYPAQSYPPEWIESRLRPLCEALEILRTELKAPITINSGYRDPAYNAAISGAKASQHMQGRAADITVKGVEQKVVHETALRLYKEGKLKIGGLGDYPDRFTHIDVRPSKRLMRWVGSRKDN